MAITDDFNRADGGPGANWTITDSNGGLVIVSNTLRANQTGVQSGIHYSGSSWNNDQSSQFLCVSNPDYCAPAVRMSVGGNWYCWFNTGSVQENVGGTSVEIANISSFTEGQTVKMTATGTTLEVFKNAVSQGTVADASHASGATGVVGQELIARVDDWVGTGETGAVGNDARLVFRLS